jgi:hypothetical protein
MCDCIKSIDDALIEKGVASRVEPVDFWDGKPSRVAVRTYVPEELQPRAKTGRVLRRERPITLIADFCPFCGEKYPESAE